MAYVHWLGKESTKIAIFLIYKESNEARLYETNRRGRCRRTSRGHRGMTSRMSSSMQEEDMEEGEEEEEEEEAEKDE